MSVARYLQLSDICSCQTLSVKNLKDIVCCEIFAVARHLQLPDKFSCQAFTVARHLLLLLAKLETSLVLMNNLANIVSLGFFFRKCWCILMWVECLSKWQNHLHFLKKATFCIFSYLFRWISWDLCLFLLQVPNYFGLVQRFA